MPMVTKDNEKYNCRFTNDESSGSDKANSQKYKGPSAQELLTGFAAKTACSQRVCAVS